MGGVKGTEFIDQIALERAKKKKMDFMISKTNAIEKLVTENNNYKRINEYTTYLRYKAKPLLDNVVVYDSFLGKSMTDNPYAIFKEILSQDTEQKIHHVWVIENLGNKQVARFENLPNVEFVLPYSKKHLQYLATAKYLVLNTSVPYYFMKRTGQVMMNTWHGTPIKGMGRFMGGRYGQWANVQRQFLMTDFITQPNAYTEEVINESYNLTGIYEGETLEIGYPRIDLIKNTNKDDFLELLHDVLPHSATDKKIILYAPTWRGNQESIGDMTADIIRYSTEIQDGLPEGYQLLVKAHQIAYDKIKNNSKVKDILVPNDVDTSELLSVTDVLITDYSSIFFDYLVTGKPVFLFAYDLEEYEADRGLLMPINSVPGNVVETMEDLLIGLNNLDTYTMNNVTEVSKYIEWQTNNTSLLAVQALFGLENKGLAAKTHTIKNELANLVVFLSGFDSDDFNQKIQHINSLDSNKYNIIIVTKDKLNDAEMMGMLEITIDYVHLFRIGQTNMTVEEFVPYSLKNQGDMVIDDDSVIEIFKDEVNRIVPVTTDVFIYMGKTTDIFELNVWSLGMVAKNKIYVKTAQSYRERLSQIDVKVSDYTKQLVPKYYTNVLDLDSVTDTVLGLNDEEYIILDNKDKSLNLIKKPSSESLLVIANDYKDFEELVGIGNLRNFIKLHNFNDVIIYGNPHKFMNEFNVIDSTNMTYTYLRPVISHFKAVMINEHHHANANLVNIIKETHVQIIDMNL